MALTRAQLVTATAGEWAQVLTLAGLAATDTSGALKEPIDKTFRALDVTEANLATATVVDGGEEQALAYAAYFVLARAVAATVSKMTVAAGTTKASLREQHENLLRLLAHALAIAQSFGLSIPGADGGGCIPIPYAGGVDQADYDANLADTSRVPPLFSVDDLTIPGVPRLDAEWGV